MAFIPESDFSRRGKATCGFEGDQAKSRALNEVRTLAKNGFETYRVPNHFAAGPENRQINYQHAAYFEHAPSLFRKLGDKLTHDFPTGGKCTRVIPPVKPSPIVTPEVLTHITGSVRRMAPLDMSPEQLRNIWSDGRDRKVRDAAMDFSKKESPIAFHNPLKQLPPVKMGVKPVEGRSNTSLEIRPPDLHCVSGFRGLGNHDEPSLRRRNTQLRASVKTHVVDPGTLQFYGRRKSDWVGYHE